VLVVEYRIYALDLVIVDPKAVKLMCHLVVLHRDSERSSMSVSETGSNVAGTSMSVSQTGSNVAGTSMSVSQTGSNVAGTSMSVSQTGSNVAAGRSSMGRSCS